MKKIKRAIAFLLCITLFVPTYVVSAADIVPEDTLPIEEIIEVDESIAQVKPELTEVEMAVDQISDQVAELEEPAEPDQSSDQVNESSHYQDTVKLESNEAVQPLEWDGDLNIYWNPGVADQTFESIVLASSSQGTASNAYDNTAVGSDHADGLTPQTAVQSLNTAIRKAEKLSRRLEVEVDDITIYAMNPMVVLPDTMYTIRGRGATIAAWPDRDDDSDLIFAIDGGQLTLSNLVLQPRDGGTAPEDADLIYIKSGKVQLGEQVESFGTFVLDYQEMEPVWVWSSTSQVTASQSQGVHHTEPVIELLKKFDVISEYILDLRISNDRESVMAVDALYSDTKSTAEFLEAFTLREYDNYGWRLIVEERIGGVLRDTTEEEVIEASSSEASQSEAQILQRSIVKKADTELTRKTLVATRSGETGQYIYWNPGPGIDLNGDGFDEYPAGDDTPGGFDGNEPTAPFKSWSKAVSEAGGRTIVCMQTIDLTQDSTEYLPGTAGNYILDGTLGDSSQAAAINLSLWSERAQPVLKIPDGVTVTFSNVTLDGSVQSVSGFSGSQVIINEGGNIILDTRVKTKEAFIQVDLNYENLLREPSITVNNQDVGQVTVYYSGINNNISWRYHDVIKAGGSLLAAGADYAGDQLLQNIKLEPANSRTIAEGGTSEYKWALRKDTDEDQTAADPSRLELYSIYYFDAVYLDGTLRGDDNNYGASCYLPVKSFSKAKEILDREMQNSVNARRNAATEAERNTISVPTKIYICGTVTVEDQQQWTLPVYEDYDGTPIIIEVRSHDDPIIITATNQPAHKKPETLINVTGSGAKLTLGQYHANPVLGESIVIRNTTNVVNSTTISVDQGATLRMEHTAELTGLSNPLSSSSNTIGTQILIGKKLVTDSAVSKGFLEMPEIWSGSINNRGIGVDAYGSGSEIMMKNGQITKNNNSQIISGTNLKITDKAGVALTGDVKFTMEGGEISENSGYQYGAGVYLSGTTTAKPIFTMKKGKIKGNIGVAPQSARSYGVGVYVGNYATFNMGIDGADDSECEVDGNTARGSSYGAGIYVIGTGQFNMSSGTVKNNRITGYNNYTNLGAGIYNLGTIQITGGLITENGGLAGSSNNNVLGAGVYLASTLGVSSQIIKNAKIISNQTGTYYGNSTTTATYTAGGGIYVARAATIENCLIESNYSMFGAGIYISGNGSSLNNAVILNQCEIKSNVNTTLYRDAINATAGYGGGMYFNGTVKVTSLKITNNKAGTGGGIYHSAYDATFENTDLIGNTAVSGGGGFYSRGATYRTYFVNCKVNANAATTGGGFYGAAALYLTEVEIKNNIAVQVGGGIYSAYGNGVFAVDTNIESNTAGNLGGGVYLDFCDIYLSEKTAGKSSLKNNTANKGGGINITAAAAFLDLTEPVINKAVGEESQGNNFYGTVGVSNLLITLVNGTYLQPTDSVEGNYNIYLDASASKTGSLRLDPQTVTIGGDQAVYLNSTNNFLVYFKAAPNINGGLPIDINQTVFDVGSPIIKPANLSTLAVFRPTSTGFPLATGEINSNYVVNYPTLKNATTNLNYSNGSKLPVRTVLGGYQDASDPSLTNVILLGEGIYLKGVAAGGSDTAPGHDGLTPATAVATFGKAKSRLEEEINRAKTEHRTEGFMPMIYICGNVLINANEVWELKNRDGIFAESDYASFEEAAGRVPEKAQIKRFTSFLNAPMVTVSGAGTTFTISELIIDGRGNSIDEIKQGANSPIIKTEANTNLILLDEAWVKNNYYNMLEVQGTLRLEGSENGSNHQIDITRGTGVNLYGNATMTMNGYSRVIISARSIDGNADNYYNPLNGSRGVVVRRESQLTMNGNSKIEFISNEGSSSSNATGVVIGSDVDVRANSTEQVNKALLIMNSNSSIIGCNGGIGLENYHVDIQMNNHSSLNKNYSGIIANGRGADDLSIVLNDDATIHNGYYGFKFNAQNSINNNLNKIKINLNQNSAIKLNTGYGIYIYGMKTNFDISMNDYASIYSNQNAGIHEGESSSMSVDLKMKGNSWMGATAEGRQEYGVYLAMGSSDQVADRTDNYKITMSDYAMIGGEGLHNAGTARRGHNSSGIFTQKPLTLKMSDSSKIAYNAGGSRNQAGLYLGQNFVYRISGTTTVEMSGDASICNNNGYGIYGTDKVSSTLVYILDHIKLLGTASIKDNNNTDVYLINPKSKIELRESALIGEQIDDGSPNYSIMLYGSLIVEGTSTIVGITWLHTGTNPITLLSAVPLGNDGKFKLHLEESYIGRIVVQPGGTLTDVTDYYSSFDKVIGTGMAEVKSLQKRQPNIILENENNVYLSTSGADTNDGRSPTNAVRTFAQARKLLREDNFTDGANIYICDYIYITSDDLDWSFDPGGFISNEQSGDTWKPVVYRYETYYEYLLYLSSFSDHLVLKDITIDGAGNIDAVAEENTLKSLILVGGGTVTLGEGTILQNNRLVNPYLINESNSALGVFLSSGATLNIEGGIIRDMTIEGMTLANNSTYGVALGSIGTVNFKSGSIENCNVHYNSTQSEISPTAIVMNYNNATFNMSGGNIINNMIDVNGKSEMIASALGFRHNASGTIKGGLISNNKGGKGSAIYYNSSKKLSLEGGRIQQNQALNSSEINGSVKDYSPIYVAQSQFEIKGGGSIIDDSIYLDSIEHIITVSGNIYQSNRRYNIYLNQIQSSEVKFEKGSIVVQPSGDTLTDASPFLTNFNVHANPYMLDRGQSESRNGGYNGAKERQCLMLMQMVFVNSQPRDTTGIDLDGTIPERAVFSFEEAKDIGEGPIKDAVNRDYFVIFTSGPLTHQDGDEWDLENASYLCRYTGFEIYDENGVVIPAAERLPYHKYMIESRGNLTLGEIRIYGRRAIDTAQSANGESIIKVQNGHTVTLTSGTLLSRNENLRSYWDETIQLWVALSVKGGAITVNNGGTLIVNGGTISDTKATFGAAIYLDADENDSTATNFGHMELDNSPVIAGDIFLHGKLYMAQAYLKVKDTYVLPGDGKESEKLYIRMRNDYSGRPVVQFDGVIPTDDQKNYFRLDDSITSIYDFERSIGDQMLLVIQLRQLIYLDGQNGNDNHTGNSPDQAFKTLKKVYETLAEFELAAGALVMVVGQIDINDAVIMSNTKYQELGQVFNLGQYKDSTMTEAETILIKSLVYFKRYSKPTSTAVAGYTAETYKGSLFKINNGGNLTLNGMYLDGHSEDTISNYDYLSAEGVDDATEPLVKIMPGGKLNGGMLKQLPGYTLLQVSTVFSNNKNVNFKTNTVGTNSLGDPVIEGSGAGIEILSTGTLVGEAVLEGVNFRNLELAEGLNGGTDIYQNGNLKMFNEMVLSGTVLIEGFGSPADPSSSRYIEVGAYGRPFLNNFRVFIRDPYDKRIVVKYPDILPNGPADNEIGNFLLEERVNRYYALQKRALQKYVLELSIPDAVYVDGRNGIDQSGNGWKPTRPVKTLKFAYERLRDSGGKVIYIVDTVDIEMSMMLSAGEYSDGAGGRVTLLGNRDHIDIRRFAKPIVGNPLLAGLNYDVEYDRPNFEGVLLNLKNGATLTLKDNLTVDGHHKPKTEAEYSDVVKVPDPTDAKASLIQVANGGTLKLQSGSKLVDNNNIDNNIYGGAVLNHGNLEMDGGVLDLNKASKGAGIYQDGTLDIISGPEGLKDQEIYLTTTNSGNLINPIWETDHIINTAVKIPDGLKLDLQMDHAVAGRPVIYYTSHLDVDGEYGSYNLGNTVPISLFLVERETNDSMLELQDWRVYSVSVPQEIFLVIQPNESETTDIANAESDGSDLASPQYSIKNNGHYDVNVYLAGFINDNADAGITAFDAMNLVASPSDAIAANASRADLYLAIRGSEPTDPFGRFPETSLYDFNVDGVKKEKMGLLLAGEEAVFEFVSAASAKFINYYRDTSFPLSGSSVTAADRVAHIRHKNVSSGLTSANHARAKFKMTYRVEMIPPRR